MWVGVTEMQSHDCDKAVTRDVQLTANSSRRRQPEDVIA